MSAQSRNDMVGLQKLQDSLVDQIGEDGKRGSRGRFICEMLTAMHAQGVVLEDAAAELGIAVNNAQGYACRLKLRFKRDSTRRKEARQALIRDGYAQGKSLVEIAKKTGLSHESVKVIAHAIGVSRTPAEAANYRRGFTIPEHLKDDYRLLTRSGGYRSREAGIALGLLEAEQ